DISEIVKNAQDPRLPEGESFFGFKSIEQARDALDRLKVELAADLNVAYSSGFVRAAAATEFFDPAEFARLGILLRQRGINLARWERTVHDQARPERERIRKAAKAKAASIELAAKQSQATEVVGLALKKCQLFHDPKDTYAIVTAGDHVETYKLTSRSF